MFPLYDFLIYCFIAAYTPGANNLLSMSNAARLGFRRLSLEYSSLKQFRQSLWLTDIFLSTCYIFYIGYVDLY